MLQTSICLLQVSYRAASDTAWVFKATNFRRQKQNRPAPKNVTLSDYQSMPEQKSATTMQQGNKITMIVVL